MKRERENDIGEVDAATVSTAPNPYWLPPELFSIVLLHAIQYSLLDEEQYKRLVRYRRVCKSWAYDIVNDSLLRHVRHWDLEVMRPILFCYDETSPFSMRGYNYNEDTKITDIAMHLFAGCQSLCVRHHRVPRWLLETVPRMEELHSIWFEVSNGEWPDAWTHRCLGLKRLVLNGTMLITTTEDMPLLEGPALPLNLETLWILAWPRCPIDKMGVDKLAGLKYYTGPHQREQFSDKGVAEVGTAAPRPILHYTRYMPKTVQSHPLIMHDFIMRGSNCPHCLK